VQQRELLQRLRRDGDERAKRRRVWPTPTPSAHDISASMLICAPRARYAICVMLFAVPPRHTYAPADTSIFCLRHISLLMPMLTLPPPRYCQRYAVAAFALLRCYTRRMQKRQIRRKRGAQKENRKRCCAKMRHAMPCALCHATSPASPPPARLSTSDSMPRWPEEPRASDIIFSA